MIGKIKRFLVKTPFHKLVLRLKAFLIANNWAKENNAIINHKTIYCISPYKTGTTFLASSFNPLISKHEPFHYTSLRRLNQNFDQYFVRRLNSLNLKLECSGFLSAYVDQLAQNEVTKKLNYICVLRKPSSWVTSLVNYNLVVEDFGQHYLWANELFFKRHAGVDLANFFAKNETEKNRIAEQLVNFYMAFTKKTAQLQHVHYVWINELNGFLPELGQWIDEKPQLKKAKKNAAVYKRFVYDNHAADKAYEKLVSTLLEQ